MLFLVLFSTLAIGFYEATALSSQIAGNESSIDGARDAADSGMRFMRYQLGSISMPAVIPSGLMNALVTQLGNQLNGTPNMNGYAVQNSGGTIYIPASGQWMSLDPSTGEKFQVAITQSGTNLNVTVTGHGPKSSIKRALQLQFQQVPLSGNIFNYGIASASEITMGGNVTVTGTPASAGSVMTATANGTGLTLNGGPSISGDYSYVNPTATNSYGSGTIAGYSSGSPNFAQHVHSGVAAPVFPVVDPSVYSQYATNTYIPGSTTLANVTLPPGTYSLSNVTIQGVLYLQSPCSLSIAGQSTIQGIIVSDCKSNVGSLITNVINLSGQVQVQGIDTLPASFSAAERALTGAFILAPYDAVNMSGNFGSISGSMIASQYSMSGNASGTIAGSMINIADTSMNFAGNASVTINHTGSAAPMGVYAGCKYQASQGSYQEVTPP
ncbi:MAG TPA: hypothetical protein VK797_20940 [Tepidisphaeraceae bacterium]|jgi:hypothetical protein|nr:hypothetical protein [Tepidisphaeraceae bacterium]